MGGRGTFASGNNVAYTYETVGRIESVKVLQGLGGKHSLPEEAHSSEAYIKLKPDGTFHEMRIYDKDHYLVKEIAYHPEPNIDKSGKPVLHINVRYISCCLSCSCKHYTYSYISPTAFSLWTQRARSKTVLFYISIFNSVHIRKGLHIIVPDKYFYAGAALVLV